MNRAVSTKNPNLFIMVREYINGYGFFLMKANNLNFFQFLDGEDKFRKLGLTPPKKINNFKTIEEARESLKELAENNNTKLKLN